MPEVILPGTYVTVRDEALISAGRVVTGNIGIVGTAAKGEDNVVQILGTFTEAKEMFGDSGDLTGTNDLTLIRALEQVYNNGGRTVYAVRTASNDLAVATFQTVDGDDNSLALLQARSPGTWGNDIRIEITDSEEVEDGKQVELFYKEQRETYQVANAFELAVALNNNSNLVEVLSPSESTLSASVPADTADGAALSGGNDGANANAQDYGESLAFLQQDIVNIVLLAGQDDTDAGMVTALMGHINTTSGIKRERIALIGSGSNENVSTIAGHSLNSERLIFVSPGIKLNERSNLSGGYTAAAVAGLLSSLPVQASPTNKVLNIPGLSKEFSSSELEKLVLNRVLAIEKREGFRVVQGITTSTNSAWKQITTRRIVDFAIYGVRSACNPYIGKLNNERVRGAMKATLDAFLTRMVEDEALISYELDVTATRAQQIAGEAIVTMTIRTTFSIDFVKVTMFLK